MATKRDYYEVLGVPRTADDASIKKAYRKVAMECHPDHHPGDKHKEERFKEASEAYEVLRDAEKRAQYDRFGHEGVRAAGFQGFGGVDDIFSHFSDLFDGLFGGRPRQGGGGQRASRGGDLRADLKLTFAEAATGATKELHVRRPVPCATCHGSGAKAGTQPQRCMTCNGRGQVLHSQGFFMIGTTCPACRGEGQVIAEKCGDCRGQGAIVKSEKLEVNVPAGVDDGQTLRVPGKGEPGRGGPPGHLYVALHVEADERFRREGADVLTVVPLPFTIAALGGTITVPTLDDACEGETEIEVEPGTQPDSVLVRRGQGLPRLEGGGRGDHVLQFKVVVPTKLSDKQKDLLRALANEGGEHVAEERRGLFSRRKK
jgi:molecular chaperone DnaJ